MAEQLGSAVLTLSVDDKQYNAGLQRAKKSLDGLTGSGNGAGFQGLSSGIAALGSAAAGAAAGAAIAGVAIAGIGAAAVQSAGGIQRLNAAFVGLTGSAEAAKQLRQDLFTLSKTTPFKNEDILQAAQRFLAVGVEVDKLQGTINRVGAIAAQSGQPLERLALIYAQVYAKGRLQGEENLQLLEAGVDLTQELSAVTGLSGTALQDAMSKGQIGIDKFNQALSLATGDMKSLQQAGQAVNVQFDNIGDNVSQVFGGFAQAISPALSAAFKVINDIFDQAFPSLDSITDFFKPLTEGAKAFSEALSGNPELVAALAASFRSIGEIIVNNLGRSLQFISELLASIDGKALVSGLLQAELILRKAMLNARALSLNIMKNAELTYKAATNPAQLALDTAKAGGIGAFISQQYKEVNDAWTASITAKPLPFPEIAPASTRALDGELSNKDKAVKLDLLRTEAQKKYVEQSQQAYDEAVALQGLQGTGLQIAKQQLQIDRLRAAERKAIAEYDKALSAAGFDRSNPAVIDAAARMEAAGLSLKTALIEGSNALINAAKEARDKLLAAELERAKQLTSQNQGLNKFLRSDVVAQRQGEGADILKPRLKAAVDSVGGFEKLNAEAQKRYLAFMGQATKATEKITGYINGIPLKEKVTPVANDTEFAQEFISAAKADEDGKRALIEANNAVAESNRALASGAAQIAGILPGLASVIEKLAAKEWNVDVAVTGGAAAIKTF